MNIIKKLQRTIEKKLHMNENEVLLYNATTETNLLLFIVDRLDDIDARLRRMEEKIDSSRHTSDE